MEIPDEENGKSKIIYFRLEEYDAFFKEMQKDRKSFELHLTSYTRKIKYGKSTYIFNSDGESDFNVLGLINKTKQDAKKYLEKNGLPRFNQSDIGWFNLVEKPPVTLISKIDLKGAYWNYALNNGIITDKTNYFLEEKFAATNKYKDARLKALGSLATRKEVKTYIDGEEHGESNWVVDEVSRSLYMYICLGIDDVLRGAAREINGAFYYYWDCIFTREDAMEEAIDYMRRAKYATSVKTTSAQIVTLGTKKWLITKEDHSVTMKDIEKPKLYPIKDDQIHLTY